jgi:5-oxoprolinase (ATP-hydrolysing)
VDPVLLEVFNNLFMNIAEQMGLQLQNTAYSVNIKERLDFSCALFDAQGNLIANAPHMPVHLGSMGESIKTVIARNAGQDAARRCVCAQRPLPRRHAPARRDRHHAGVPGGGADKPLFYVGSRGHHADIGGTTPGSMPPFSTTHRGRGRADQQFQAGGPGRAARGRDGGAAAKREYPSRNPQQNMADLKAQIAANEKGVQELRKMVDQFGLDVVQAYMGHVQDNAEESVRRVITR